MSRGHHQGSYKRECRIRLSGTVKRIPNDLHSRLNEQKTIGRYPTLWSTAQRAIDLGLSVMEAQQNAATEVVRRMGISADAAGPGRAQL